MIKLDYSLKTPEERRQLVEKILEENPNPSQKYLDILADYLVLCMEKEEKREKKIMTANRYATISKRETSLEGLASQFENGEDGIYDLIVEQDKNIILNPKIAITEEDLEQIPELQQAKNAISYWEDRLKTASGKEAFIIKKAIIDFRRDQYIIKNSVRVPVQTNHAPGGGVRPGARLEGYVTFDEKGQCVPHGVSFLDPEVCGAILREYNVLKIQSKGSFHSEVWSLVYDFEQLCTRALANYPVYQLVVKCKYEEMANADIAQKLKDELGVSHSPEYISSLWRKKIPKVIASQAEDEYLNWYYLEVEKGQYKKCGRCGEVKLAHSKYFCKNKNSRDGWYSICKECRSKKHREGS